MQNKSEKTLYLRRILGELIRAERLKKGMSCNKLEEEYEIGSGNISRIESAVIDAKFITIWRILEALDIDFIEFASMLKEKLSDSFKLMDE